VTVTAAERVGPSGHVFSNELDNKRLGDSGRSPYHPKRAALILASSSRSPRKASPNEKRSTSSMYSEEQIIMFETAVQEKRTTLLWGIIMGVVAFAALLGAGYALIA
jgi:hypothetical protein